MRRIGTFAVVLWLAAMAQAQPPAAGAAQKAPPPPMKLKVGDTAPEFTLLAFDGQKMAPVSLKDFKGKKNVALAFYVFAFTGG